MNTTTTRTTRSSILMNNILNWQIGSCSDRPPNRMLPLYHPHVSPDLGQEQRLFSDKLPNLCETINQARGARAAAQVPVQSVSPVQLPFASVRDLDRQCQLCHDQTLAKRHPSPLKAEQHKSAKTPPQPDPHDALDGGCAQMTEWESRDWGHSRVRDEDRQKELDKARVCSKSRKHSKSCQRSKSRRQSKSRRRSKSRGRNEAEACSRYEMRRPGVWSSQCRREEPSQSPSSTTKQGGGTPSSQHPATKCPQISLN